MKDIHIGSLIRQKLEESPLSISEFASLINRTRTTVYDIFNRKSIDVDLLLSISEVLNYNFLEEVYLMEKSKRLLPPLPDASFKFRYIVGQIVDEKQLKDYPISEYPVVLKIIDGTD